MKYTKILWISLLQTCTILLPNLVFGGESTQGAFLQNNGKQIKEHCQQVYDKVLTEFAHLETFTLEKDILAVWNKAYIQSSSMQGPVALLAEVSPDTLVRDESNACLQRLNNMWTDILQRQRLYERILEVKPHDAIDTSAKQFILEQFELMGITLPTDKRQQFKKIQTDLNALSLQFQKNIASYKSDTNKLTFSAAELNGANLVALAKFKQPNGNYILDLSRPVMDNILGNVTDSQIRRRYYIEYMKRGGEANIAILQQLSDKRRQLARLLGYDSYAAWVLRYKMAGTPEVVNDFLAKIDEKILHLERQELNELNHLKVADGDLTGIKRWDVLYYQNKLKSAKYNVDEEQVRKQFPTAASVDWVMQVASQLYGITFKENSTLPRWHNSVKAYDVYDDLHYLGTMYLDLFPRENKYNHAAMFPIRQSSTQAGITPISVLVTNFSERGLSQMELETLFHEFGHVLHEILSKTRYSFLAGTNVKQDFVEAPSQLFESWARNNLSLAIFSKACPSCTPIDKALIEKMNQTENFGKGISYARQRLYAAFDLSLAGKEPVDVMASFKSLEAATPLGYIDETYMPASFGHLAGGYAAGYYGYLWSEALVSDMLSAFGDNLMDTKIAKRYQLILQRGGEIEPNQMLTEFLGRTPNEKAFFNKLDSIGNIYSSK